MKDNNLNTKNEINISNFVLNRNQANVDSGPDEILRSSFDGLFNSDIYFLSSYEVSNIKEVVVRIMPTTTYDDVDTDNEKEEIYTPFQTTPDFDDDNTKNEDTDSEKITKNTSAYKYANPIDKLFIQTDFILFLKKPNYRNIIYSFLNIQIQYQGSLTKYTTLHHQNTQQHLICLLNKNIIRKVGEKDGRIKKYRELYAKFNGNSPKKMNEVVEWYALTDEAVDFYKKDIIKNWLFETISPDIKHNVQVLGLKRLQKSHREIQQERETKQDNHKQALNILIRSKNKPEYATYLLSWSEKLAISMEELEQQVEEKIAKDLKQKETEILKTLRKNKGDQHYDSMLKIKARVLGISIDDLIKKLRG